MQCLLHSLNISHQSAERTVWSCSHWNQEKITFDISRLESTAQDLFPRFIPKIIPSQTLTFNTGYNVVLW